MTNTKPAAATKAAAKKPARKVAEGKINHTACYETNIHASTTADRALRRGLQRDGRRPTKVIINKARADRAAKKAAPNNTEAAESSTDEADAS